MKNTKPIKENIIDLEIVSEMQSSYLDYSMSVIISRALADVRDGLKPVHRRILYAMHETGTTSDKPYKKSARVVGEVLGKYHPHGDSSVYGATVRLAQNFVTNYLMVDGHGNFGSVDGDSAAAMRYTEIRLTKIAEENLDELDKNTVDMNQNYDQTLKEPSVLPAKVPLLLLNGSEGIAVGMASSIPPHNLTEVMKAFLKLIENEDITVNEIIKTIKGPDFPTGAYILGKSGILDAYKTGRGKVLMRGKASIERLSDNKEQIIITDLPYQVNKAKFVEKIAFLSAEKIIEGISDLRDESKKENKIVIELKKDANANKILNLLYKHTDLQKNFGVNFLCLVPDRQGKLRPKTLNILEILQEFLKHREEVTRRKFEFDLAKAKKKEHILQGLIIALENIDNVISIIRKSKTTAEANEKLKEKYKFTNEQANHILEVKLQGLTSLEIEKVQKDHKTTLDLIAYIENILSDRKNILEEIKKESLDILGKYGDSRKTEILNITGEIDLTEEIIEEEVIVSLTNTGYIKRLPLDTYKTQKKGGKGVSGLSNAKENEDIVQHLFSAKTQNLVLFFTDTGKMHKLSVNEIPEHSRISRGSYISNIIDIPKEEKITAVLEIESFDNEDINLLMFTKLGGIKKIPLIDLKTNRKFTTAIKLKEDDTLVNVCSAKLNEDIFIATKKGLSIRINEQEINNKGKTAGTIRAIKLKKDDSVVSADIIQKDFSLLTITEQGLSKKTHEKNYKVQARDGSGVTNIKLNTGDFVVGSLLVEPESEVILITSSNKIIRTPVDAFSDIGRTSKGSRIMNLNDNEVIKTILKVKSNTIEENEEQ